jgi:hypothetical protein
VAVLLLVAGVAAYLALWGPPTFLLDVVRR